jgi:long-subunit acyl-CoA synthetase (AMP-forming)/GNAT superfamily N-acetyltransferase
VPLIAPPTLLTTPTLESRASSTFARFTARWTVEAALDADLPGQTQVALRAVQPDDLAALRPLVAALLVRLDQAEGARRDERDAIRRTLFALLDTVRRRFFVEAMKPGDAAPWTELIVSVVDRSDFTFGELLRAREETDPKVVALRVLGADACELTVEGLGRSTRALARGMLTLLRGDADATVAILSENRLEAALCDLACLSNGIVDFPLPANAVADQIVYMLRHSGARILLVSDQEQLGKVLPALGSLPDLREIVVFDRRVAAQNGLLSLDQMVGQGSDAFDDAARAARAAGVKSRDLATALYTSGTTGRPKAIAFSHLNVVSKRFCRAFALPRVGEGDVFLAYLPLYHTFGRWFELTGSLFWGATYVFARSTSRASLAEDFRAVRPTIFISVPKKWIELHETARRDAPADESEAASLAALCGGRLRHGLSAAGYLDPVVFKAFHDAGVELCSGYGMTEATGGITMTAPGQYVEGSIGRPLPGVEVRRADDGELLIRGPYVSAGYYRAQPGDVGADADGWFATGDLVSVDETGHHAITGRKKEIYKNRMGQTIAPQRVENIFRDFDAVAQAFLVGDHREYNTLLIWPNREGNAAVAERSPEGLRELLSSLVASANSFLAPFERVVAFAILPRALDEEHGELTAKQSFKREVVEKNWAALIDTLYGEKHLTLAVDGAILRLPKWVLREMSVLQHEVVLVGSVLSAGGRPLPVSVDPGAPGSMRVGDLAYTLENGVLDLGALLARPAIWLGNEAVRAFLGGEAFLSLLSQRRRGGAELRIDPRVWPSPEPARLSRLIERLESSEVTFLSLHAAAELLRGERSEARRAILHLQHGLGSGGDHAALCQAMLRRAADAPDDEVRRLALGALLPSEAAEHTLSTLRYFLDRLGPTALRDEDLATLGDRGLEGAQIDALFAFLSTQAAAVAHEASDRRLIAVVMRILAASAIAHPRYYAAVRVPLARLAHHPEEDLAARAREELDRVRRGFSHWIGPNLRRAIDPETGDEYGWKDVVVFDDTVDERAREILLRAIAETTLVRASVFLFGRGALLSLADLRPGAAAVTRLGGAGGKSVYRLSIETRARDEHELCINVSEQLHPMDLRDEMDWLLAAGGSPPVVEAFGGYYPELGVFTEEHIPGAHVAAQAARLVRSNEGRRLGTLWPFLAQTAFALHTSFWERTGRRFALVSPEPEMFIVPAHDYQGGARLVSIARRSRCEGLDDLIDRFRAAFIEPLQARYPGLLGDVEDEQLLAAAVEALGVLAARSAFEAAANGPRAPLFEAQRARLATHGHTPLRVANAARRYRRWIDVNPSATVEARGIMLGELWSTYRLAEVEATATDTRVRFFRQTVFADARPELAAELDRLMVRARVAPFSSVDVLGEHLAAHRAAVKPTPEEDYFLARMTYRYLEPSDEAALISIPQGEKKLATVVMGLRDTSGDRYFVRRPATPREVGRILQLFHDANLAVALKAESEVMLALDARENVIGGLLWHWRAPLVAQMDKMVVTRSHRGKGVGDGLLRELLRRLRGRGARSVSTGYFQAEYFKQFGFRTDPTSGGLVVDLEAVPGSMPPLAAAESET